MDLVVALPPEGARIATSSDLAALATHALTHEGVMVVAVAALSATPRGNRGLRFLCRRRR